MTAPSSDEIVSYLAATGMTSWSDEEVSAALSAELGAQSHACVLPADDEDWPADLAEALKRRVARNLALRKLPIGIVASDATAIRVTSHDVEVRRLEAPYRRWVVA